MYLQLLLTHSIEDSQWPVSLFAITCISRGVNGELHM